MKKHILGAALLVFCAFLNVAFSAPDLFTPKALTEVKQMPGEISEVVGMVKQGDLLEIKSTMMDSAGESWYLVSCQKLKIQGFVPSASVEFFGDEDKGGSALQLNVLKDEEKKKRLTAIKLHPDWPRRIKSMVRTGSVCLKMNEEQLISAWEDPYLRTKGFVLGLGDVDIWFFRQPNPVAVVMKKGEVVGWSERK